MSRKNNPLSNRASLSLIAADTKFFRDFALDPHSDSFRSVAGLTLMPFLSAFAYESVKYFERTNPTAGRILQANQDMLLWSRMRTKLTEDKYKTSAAVVQNVEELIAINSGWFLEGHRGIRRPLRLIQPDVGLTFMNNEMIYTTHVAFLNLGLTKESLSDSSLNMDNIGGFLHDRMVPVGQYVQMLTRKLNVGAHTPADSPAPAPLEQRDRDPPWPADRARPRPLPQATNALPAQWGASWASFSCWSLRPSAQLAGTSDTKRPRGTSLEHYHSFFGDCEVSRHVRVFDAPRADILFRCLIDALTSSMLSV